ncbi:MAG: hypothetical protein ABR927_17490 [Bacteroidales bacterium]|jgi:hypothetical protein
MNRNNLLYVFILFTFTVSGLFDIQGFGQPLPVQISQKAPLKEDQILYNGKVWHNLYNNVKGDQFLFSKEYLQGSLTIDGKLYNNLSISYDIYNDEIITPSNNGSILQLNKEMVDSFTLVFEFKTYMFKNTLEDSLTGVKGFVNVLYKGKSALYVKYKKEIQLLAVDDKYDLFIESFHIYFLKDGIVHQLNNKSDLLKILYQDKAQIKDFIKKNKLKVSKKVPESFIPVIRYYDSISH